MAIFFKGDGDAADVTYGGHSTQAANWTKTFNDYRQGSANGQFYYHAARGTAGNLIFPFKYSITVLPRSDPGTGSYDSDGANRYYPVSFSTGDVRRGFAGPNLVITRSYSWSGPYQFEQSNSVDIGWTGSSTHQGGLYAAYITGDSAWSDMYEAECRRYRMTYHSTIADHGMLITSNSDRGSGPFWVLLRGGFTYDIYAAYPAVPTQVKAGGGAVTYNGNDAYASWPNTRTDTVTKSGLFGTVNYSQNHGFA